MAQWMESLLHRHEDLNSDPQYPYEKLDSTTCSWDLRAGEVKIGEPWG